MATYAAKSFFYKTPQDNWGLGYYVDRGLNLDNSDTYQKLLPRHHLRPDLLSYDLYGDPDYWWIIFRMNMNIINDPMRDFISGLIVRCPSIDRVRSIG